MRSLTVHLAIAVVAVACGGPTPGTPEEEIHRVLHAVEVAAEEGDISAIRALIADGYRDDRGRDKKAVVDLARLHVLRNRERHVLSRIAAVDLVEPDRARVSLHAALAARDVADFESLAGVRANLYAFEIALAREGAGAWRITEASWRPARPAELF